MKSQLVSSLAGICSHNLACLVNNHFNAIDPWTLTKSVQRNCLRLYVRSTILATLTFKQSLLTVLSRLVLHFLLNLNLLACLNCSFCSIRSLFRFHFPQFEYFVFIETNLNCLIILGTLSMFPGLRDLIENHIFSIPFSTDARVRFLWLMC